MVTKMGAKESGLCDRCCAWGKKRLKCMAMDHGQGPMYCAMKYLEEKRLAGKT